MANKRDDTKALATLEEAAKPAIPGVWSEEEQGLIRAIAGDAINTPREMKLFARVCNHFGLDPFMRQIYAVKYQGKLTFQTGIDGYRLIAQRTGKFGGQSSPEWYDTEREEWVDVWVKDEAPGAARVTVYRTDGIEPTVGIAMFREYAQYAGRGNERRLNSQWSQRPAHMLAKCAEALALRRAFPADMSGVYTSEETGAWVDQETGEIHPPEDAIEGQFSEVDADDNASTSEQASPQASGPAEQASEPAAEDKPATVDVDGVIRELRTLGVNQEGMPTMGHVAQVLPEGKDFAEKLKAWVGQHPDVPVAPTLWRDALDLMSGQQAEAAGNASEAEQAEASEAEAGQGSML